MTETPEACGPESCPTGGQGGTCACPCHDLGKATCEGCTSMHGGAADPTEMAAMMWKKAFFQAMSEIHVEKLKKRIDAAWGPGMDKAADAIVESMGKHWQSMLLRSSADKELHEKLDRIFAEAQKQR